MRFCRRQLSVYQRRSMRIIEIMMGISIAVSILLQAVLDRHNLTQGLRFGLATLSVAPVITTIFLVARYLHGEKDEYLRNLVVESLLWGLGLVLMADTFLSYLQPYYPLVPIGNISLDLFVLTASAALEIKLWCNQ